MSFEELMTHAAEIQQKAIHRAVINGETAPEYARGGVEGYYADIPELFRPFSQMPDPAAYQPLIDDLKVVLNKLSSGEGDDPIKGDIYKANEVVQGNMATAADYMVDWTGAAAMAFKQNFLDTFPPIVRNQFILACTLKSALEAHQAMWASARVDVDRIAHETRDALDNAGCCDKNEWTITFTVVASVAAVGAAVVSAGTAAPITITAIGAAAQVAAAAPPGNVERKGAGETAIQIINEMKRALNDLAGYIQDVETTGNGGIPGIAPAIRRVSELVVANRKSFVANRPELANGRGRNLTGPDQLGKVR